MRHKAGFLFAVASLAIACLIPDAALAATVVNPGGNTSIATALNVDADFSLDYDVDIESGSGTNHSTTVPHVTVQATSEAGAFHYYSFTVPFAGAVGIFDTDYAQMNGLDTLLGLIDTDGSTVLSGSDDSLFDGPGDMVTPWTHNSFFTYTFGAPGLYYLQVGEPPYNPFSGDGMDYTLHISIGEIPEPGTFLLLGSGLGLLGLWRRRVHRKA